MRVLATAGHVDHGKSTLLRALTGMEPDRLAEERRRGLSLDLGFVWGTLPSGRDVAFVDVPGHHRLVRTMIAGVGAVDSCLFVVAADDGWMPQSEEHLRILELVGTRAGVIALTKTGMADADTIDRAATTIRDRVQGTFLADAPLLRVDSVAGQGLDDLADALDVLVDGVPEPVDAGRPRLWIDRGFTIDGAGTVVTGTLTGGTLAVGETMGLVDRAGRVHPVRVRGLQRQGRDCPSIGPGQRVAVNVTGLSAAEVGRGAVLIDPGQWHLTRRFDAEIKVLPGATVSARGSLVIAIGTQEQSPRIRPLAGPEITSDAPGTARCWLRTPVPLLPGDRFVLRDTGAASTVGGGTVLDVDPVLPVSRAAPTRSVDRVVAEHGMVDPDRLVALTGERWPPTHGRWICSPTFVQDVTTRLYHALDEAGPDGVDASALSEADRVVLPSLTDVAVDGGRVRRGGRTDGLDHHPWLRALEHSPFTPPPPEDTSALELRQLKERGLVVEEDGVYFATSALEAGRRRIVGLLAVEGAGVTISQIREALDTTRKYALPIANAFDRRGITRRRGDRRVAGPRADRPFAARPT